MAAVDGDLIYEILKKMQADISSLKEGQSGIVEQIVSIRLTQMAAQNDVHNIYGMVARTDERLDRIESRLELREMAERPQASYQPE